MNMNERDNLSPKMNWNGYSIFIPWFWENCPYLDIEMMF